MFGSLIDIRDAPAICDIVEQKIVEHLLKCDNCKPGVKCIQYMCLAEIRDILRVVEGNQRDQKN